MPCLAASEAARLEGPAQRDAHEVKAAEEEAREKQQLGADVRLPQALRVVALEPKTRAKRIFSKRLDIWEVPRDSETQGLARNLSGDFRRLNQQE